MASYVPVTPAGSILMHLEADTRQQAIDNLLTDIAHIPLDRSWDDLELRGYEVVEWKSEWDKP